MKSLIKFVKKNYILLILLVIFAVHLFFRFYQLEERFTFGWDQVDNAWAAKSIIVDKNYPLLGMVAKSNTGIYIGPIYYYYVAIFYYLTGLHPIASSYIAGFTSIISFFVLFYITKKIFNEKIALIAIFIHTFSVFIIVWDRNQWPVNFIAPVSALILYSLYKVITSSPKYILPLAVLVALSLHVHFTSVFYAILIFLTLPLWPRSLETFKYIVLSIPIFALIVSPILIANSSTDNANAGNLSRYINSNYHGFHLRRFLQIAGDAFIEIGLILQMKEVSFLRFLLLPIFYFLYLGKKITYEKKILSYLFALWFLIPWIAFSVYSGEITNYYFSITRPIAIMIMAYVTYKLIFQKYKIITIAVLVFWSLYVYVNVNEFFKIRNIGLKFFEEQAIERVKEDQSFKFRPGEPELYFNYFYIEKMKSNGEL